MERTFEEQLVVSLTLTVGGKAHPIPAGNIKRFGLDLWSWGLEGEVEFLLTDNQAQGGKQKDELLADFLKPDLAEVSLEVKAVLSETSGKPAPKPLKVKGLVASKTLNEEVVTTGDGNLVLHRRYGVRFQDPARLLWRQHHPCVLYTKKTFKDALEAHKGDKISLAYDWDAVLGKQHPIVFVGGLDPQGGASFYDWVLWLVHGQNGVLVHDYATHGYKLSAAKDASGTPQSLDARNLEELEVRLPEVIRHDVRVLNAVAQEPKQKDVTQQHSVSGIRQDVLLCTPISAEMDAQVTLETARLKATRGPELELLWRSFPEKPVVPGELVKLPDDPAWGAAGLAKGETLRVRSVHLHGEGTEADEEVYADPTADFLFHLSARLEQKDDASVELPAWQPPRYPRYLEGLIVSELEDDKKETWNVYTDQATSVDQYHVKIPLFDNQVVPAPFNPNLLPGHFYFPAYKGEKVLVGFDLTRAWIKRFLDWRTGARLPQDGQGVQLLVGKTTESGTAIKHYYTDDKPVLLMQRTNEKDTQKIQLEEGNLLIQVKEDQ